MDLSWNDEGELSDMPDDEHPIVQRDWQFQKEFFKEVPCHMHELSHYAAVVHKLGRYLYPDEISKVNPMELSAPLLLKMKIRAEWEEWESAHPEMGRAGYLADPKQLHSREIMEGQLDWRKNWFRSYDDSLKIYAESPQDLRIDPTYCPCKRRYDWKITKKW